MIIAHVIGTVVATRKHEQLSGATIQIVQPIHPQTGGPTGQSLVALDVVGAGVGETVIVVTGSSARLSMDNPQSPVDASIVGIVDQMNVEPFSGKAFTSA
ncbi:EutN/CcmL family microcompartment protein [Desulfobulbus rhabdoformis]|jgi:ethanolamine utilization protein EutN|uniref:EutN/CcmL family microcompartment protein n=1 Tax=Desulfobulbus rhabdoformis TaxID=34032 RepID=UPI001964122E|nr:EutN/CcmL family microcompartment protein [Desulfobulbus rhabdoformis]MBM9615114.1 EutN/CcmL family microcompartment protein [Desulfobulbus rhabdoformis]